MLSSELREFLGSFKNSESLSSELRRAIQIETPLHEALLRALGRTDLVLLTGSAGSGKSHLLESVLSNLPSSVSVSRFDSSTPPRGDYVVVVPDATELTPAERLSVAQPSTGNRYGTIMAINEGPLREVATLDESCDLAKAVDILHAGQRGLSFPRPSRNIMIMDLGAFDPLEGEVVGEILNLSLLREVVRDSPCSCDVEECPRKLAWEQLNSSTVRSRVADLCRLARLVEPDWLFRDIWDFVSDISLEGSCTSDPPTSPWFWRLFYGDSRLSRALREVADPIAFALPRIDSRLFFSDWASDQLRLVDEVGLLPLSQPGASEARFGFVKSQVSLMGNVTPLASRALRFQEGTLSAALLTENVGPFLKAINEYMVFGLRAGAGTKLELTLEHSVRRASRRPSALNGLLKVGEAPSDQFEIRSSQVVMNHPDALNIRGKRQFLVHKDTHTSFELTQERIHLLNAGRSLRLSDRDHLDLAWDLTRFFEGILKTRMEPVELGIILLDFERLTANPVAYRADASTAIIEPAE